MVEIQKIVTSAGWLDQCPGGPPSLDFDKIKPETYHLHSGMPLLKNSINRSYLEEIRHFLHSLVRGLERTQIKMMFKL